MAEWAKPPSDASEFPSEPFPCPHCGQLLAPTVRVCVACKQPIEPHQIARPAPPPPPIARPVEPAPVASAPAERARFSWGIFFRVLFIWFAVTLLSVQFLKYATAQMVLEGLILLSSIWVFYDAQKKALPKPFRWAIGSLLLWIVVFPWYLSRRQTPHASCPFIEAEASTAARAFLFILAAAFLVAAVMALLKGHGL
jgi:uncharacterized membrane protein